MVVSVLVDRLISLYTNYHGKQLSDSMPPFFVTGTKKLLENDEEFQEVELNISYIN